MKCINKTCDQITVIANNLLKIYFLYSLLWTPQLYENNWKQGANLQIKLALTCDEQFEFFIGFQSLSIGAHHNTLTQFEIG